MKLKRYTPGCVEKGFTLLELLVALFIGVLAVGLCLGAVLSVQESYRRDVVRTRINQDLRAALDIIGSAARVAGENFNRSFPAVMITNGSDGAADELILRRNLLDEVLKVCVALEKGTSQSVVFAAGLDPGCVYAANQHSYDVWRAWRLGHGGSVRAYVFSTATDIGEYFDYVSENSVDGELKIWRSGTWQYDYDADSSACYMMEEWRFRISNGILQLIENGEKDLPLNVAFGITDLQVSLTMQDGSELSAFDASADWTKIKSINVTLTGQETFRGELISRELKTSFFPRNVLSN